MTERMEGEVIGWVVVTWPMIGGWPLLDPAVAPYGDREEAEERAAELTEASRAAGLGGDVHQALPVISVEEERDA